MLEKPIIVRSLKARNIMHSLYGILAGTTKNEPKMQEDLKLGFYCI
jgi:hypothetical protein